MANPYTVLGLSPGASAEDCKQAFRTRAKTCHPDLHPNDAQAEARFKELNTAYDSIVNPPPEPMHTFNPQNFGFNFDFHDIFSQMNAQRRRQVVQEVRLSLEDVFFGKTVTLRCADQNHKTYEVPVKIPRGLDSGSSILVQGQGANIPFDIHVITNVTPHPRFNRQGFSLITSVSANVFDVLLRKQIDVIGIDGGMIKLDLPNNFDSSQKIRLASQGMANDHGARGDLFVELLVKYPMIPEAQKESVRKISANV